jgi:hypothetical protein
MTRPNTVAIAWTALVLATLASWRLGTDHGPSSDTLAGAGVLLVGFIKVRVVGLYFMDLREAPRNLRGVFEAWCLFASTITIGMFVLA